MAKKVKKPKGPSKPSAHDAESADVKSILQNARRRLRDLHEAVKATNSAVTVRSLLADGVNVNMRNRYGETPLHTAVLLDNRRALVALIEGGANLEWSDCGNGSPLWLASKKGAAVAADILARRGAKVNRAIKEGKGPLRLRKHDNCPVPRAGQAPMHMAAHTGAHDVIVVLYKHGANVNLRDRAGQTPLHVSTFSKDSGKTFDLLVRLGANPNVKDRKGKTPLDYLNADSKTARPKRARKSIGKRNQIDSGTTPISAQEEIAPPQSASPKERVRARPRIADPEERTRVERAAVDTVKAFYEALGFAAESVEAENKGWDLEIRKGRKVVLRVEVKGNKGVDILVELTPNEYEKSGDPQFRLAVVRNALTDSPACAIYEKRGDEWMRGDGENGGNDESAPERLSTTERISALIRPAKP